MKYGKLNKNKELIVAPKKLHVKNKFYYNPDEAALVNEGYFPIQETDCPDDDNVYRKDYELKDGYILQTWVLLKDTEFENKTEEELLADNGVLEARISLLEAKIAFILEQVNLKKAWHKHKHKPKKHR